MRGCEIRTCDQKKGPPAIYAAGPTVQQVLHKLDKYKRLIRGLTNDNTVNLNLLSRSRGSNARLTKRARAIYTARLSTQQIRCRLDVYKGFTRGPHNDDQRGFPSCSHVISVRSRPRAPRLAACRAALCASEDQLRGGDSAEQGGRFSPQENRGEGGLR